MRDPGRIPLVLEVLCAVWETQPDLRLGQLILNLGVGFYTEDDALLAAMETHAASRADADDRDGLRLRIQRIIGLADAVREEPVEFDSLDDLLADLNDDSEGDATIANPTSEVFTPTKFQGRPSETLRQMRDDELY